jgi:hypothetical protein
MSDTPRTDALPRIRQAGATEYVPIDDCRQLERELTAKTEAFDRLNESLPKTKRLFTNALAETIINNQLKRIKLLEDELILAIKENL